MEEYHPIATIIENGPIEFLKYQDLEKTIWTLQTLAYTSV